MNFLRFGLVQATRRRCTGSHEHGILLGADIVRHLRTEARARERLASRGRNLGQRYHQKEQPLKGKETRFHEVQDLEKSAEAPQAASLVPDQPTLSGESSVASYPEVGSSKPGVKTFRGLIIPQKPEPPADDECCMSGCAICVYDLYDESLEAYDQSLDALRTSLRGLAVPEDEWPATIRPQSQNSQKGTATETPTSTRGAVLSAFEEMERALKAKSEAARSKAESTGATNVATKVDARHITPHPLREPLAVNHAPRREARDSAHGRQPQTKRSDPNEELTLRNVIEGIKWVVFGNR